MDKPKNRIKEVLEARGIKQTWLAERLGKSFCIVNSFVCNRRQPSLDVLFEIAKILNVDPKELIISEQHYKCYCVITFVYMKNDITLIDKIVRLVYQHICCYPAQECQNIHDGFYCILNKSLDYTFDLIDAISLSDFQFA